MKVLSASRLTESHFWGHWESVFFTIKHNYALWNSYKVHLRNNFVKKKKKSNCVSTKRDNGFKRVG